MHKSIFYSYSDGNHPLLFVSFLVLAITLFFNSFAHYLEFLSLPFWALWMPYMLTSAKILTKNEITYVKVSLSLLTLIFIYKVFGYSSIYNGTLLNNTNWIMSGVVAVFAMKMLSKRELSNIYLLSSVFLFLLLLLFIRDGRYLLLLGEQQEASGVASTSISSLFMLISGLSLIVFMQVKVWLPRAAAFSLLLLTIYFNFFIMQRGINVIFTLAEIGMILVFVLKRKSLIYILSVVIISVSIFVYSSGLLINIFEWAADVVPSDRLASRFNEISTALMYEDIEASSGSLSGRNRLIGISWNTFTSNIVYFFFGAGEHSQNNLIIGHHSFFVDTLACYGIVGGALVITLFVKQYKIIMSVLNKKKDWALYMQCSVVFLFYVMRNINGGITTGLSNFIIIFFFPLTFQTILFYKEQIKIKQ